MTYTESRISELVARYKATDKVPEIVGWRQRIEEEAAQAGHRPSSSITEEQALHDFFRSLLTITEHSESAKVLLREFKRPAEEANLNRLLAHFEERGESERIRSWRQQIEDEDATTDRRAAETVTADKAVHYFRAALLYENHRHHGQACDLLHELKGPVILRLSMLQDPERRPPNLTPTERVYCEQFDRAETEAAKWEIEVPADRLCRWNQWTKLGLHRKVYEDQVRLFTQWLDNHPDRAHELARHFAEWPGLPSPNRSKTYELFYQWNGLYWLAVNVVFKQFGFGDQLREEVGRALFDRLYAQHDNRPFDQLPEKRREELNAAFGQAMYEAHNKLARKGADTIQSLERWLAHSAKLILDGGRAVDPETKKRQRREKNNNFSATDSSEPSLDHFHGGEASEQFDACSMAHDPHQEFMREFYQFSEEDQEDQPFLNHPANREATSNLDTSSTAELMEFMRALSDQQKTIFGLLIGNPLLSNSELAHRFNLTPQRIGQIKTEIYNLWESR